VLLRALAQRLPRERVSGSIAYSGVPADAVAATTGVNLRSLLGFVDQLDMHLGQLTVRETLEFAHRNACVSPALAGHPDAVAAAAGRVDEVLSLLGVANVADSLIGNEMIRGVSGGEKKRVTVGEWTRGRTRAAARRGWHHGLG
jgi:ABC-type multidrug transport system ATPase subunit